jgi:UrcA family protein
MVLKARINPGIAAASILWMACTVVHADNVSVVAERPAQSTTVSFRDLDLQQPGDVARLYGRLKAAADLLCGPRAFNVFYYTLPKYQACVDDAVRRSVAHIHQPALSAYSRQQLTQSATTLAVAR